MCMCVETQNWGMSNAESREAEELMAAETSEELSYLVDQVIVFVGDMTRSDVT